MTFVEARNLIIGGLQKHIGATVVLSDDIADRPEYPYGYYSVLAARISDHAFGLMETRKGIQSRSERVSATLSFTFCSENRSLENGTFIYGEDEALGLAEKANGFFLLNAHNIQTAKGDVVISRVGSVANRSGFLVEDTVRRYGFDIAFSYVRTDEKETTTIAWADQHGTTHK